MKERPILFSAPMVRANIEDRKTQTRRPMNPQPQLCEPTFLPGGAYWIWRHSKDRGTSDQRSWVQHCPYGAPGDFLWVRENFRLESGAGKPGASEGYRVHYEADGAPNPEREWGKQHPSIHLPRWACRLVLRVTDVRVERLQDISEADALAEGIIEYEADCEEDGDPAEYAWDDERGRGEIFPSARCAYEDLWRRINGRGSWDANPWVWAVSFERV